MRVLSIAFKDLIITLKDKKALALIVLMPLALIFVLGMGLSSMFGDGGAGVKRFDIAFVNKDDGEMAAHLREFLESNEIKKMVTIKEMGESEALEKVKKGDLAAMVLLPPGFSKQLNEGKEANIEIYQDPGSPMRSKIVESLIRSFSGVTAAVQSSVNAADPVFKLYSLDGRMILPEVMKSLSSENNIEFSTTDIEKKRSLSAIQYYSAAMLVMYILFVASIGTTSIIQEKENKTLLRLMSTTVSKTSILSGKLLGLVFIAIFDVSVLILFTRFVFGVDWGSSLLAIILLTIAMIFAASGFAMFIATIFKTSKSVDAMSPAVIMVMSFLGGSMFPMFSFPPVLQTISKITLNNWAQRGYVSLMLGNGLSSIVTPIIVLCVMGGVFLTAGISRLRLN